MPRLRPTLVTALAALLSAAPAMAADKVALVVKSLGNGEVVGLVARYSGPGLGNHYEGLVYNSNGTARAALYLNQGANWNQLSHESLGALSNLLNKVLRFEVKDTSLKLFLDGNEILSRTDSMISAAGGAGMRTVGMASLDNFLVGTI